MRNLSRAASTSAIALLTLLSVLVLPAQANESSSPASQQATTEPSTVDDDSAPAEPIGGDSGPDPLDENAPEELGTPLGETRVPDVLPEPSPSEPSLSVDREMSGLAASSVYTTQILAPVEGTSIPAGSVAYRVQVATPGDYWLDLYCGGEFLDDVYLTSSAEGQQFSGRLGSVAGGESCRLELYAAGGAATGGDWSSFAVAVELSVRNAAATPDVFYPRVRDGFRDATSIAFGSRLDSDVEVKIIRSATGSVVRTYRLAGRNEEGYYGRRSVRWNGKNRSGNLVPTGRYRAVVSSTMGTSSAVARVPITVAQGHRTVRVTKSKDGWYDSRDETRGNCYALQVSDGNDLDCWGGVYAQASYRFGLPSNARNIDWGVRGYNECCSNGRIIKTGERTSATSFRVRVRVTNWRSFVVRRTWVTYTYRKAI